MIIRYPESCYVCDGGQHPDTTAAGGHRFWSWADAHAHFLAEARQQRGVRYSDGTSTPEAHYVAEHRPY